MSWFALAVVGVGLLADAPDARAAPAPVLSAPAASAAPQDATWRLAGLDHALDSLSSLLEAQTARDPRLETLSAAERWRLSQAIKAAFEPGALRRLLLQEFQARWAVADDAAWRLWQESPVGLRLIRHWQESPRQRPEAFEAGLTAGRAFLESMPPVRRQRLQDLLTASGTLKRSVLLLSETTRAVHRGFSGAATAQQPMPSTAQVELDLQALVPTFILLLEPVLLARMAAEYQAWTDDDLALAVHVLQQDPARRFQVTLDAAVLEVLRSAHHDLGVRMGRIGDRHHP
jgi:hypothetical protein